MNKKTFEKITEQWSFDEKESCFIFYDDTRYLINIKLLQWAYAEILCKIAYIFTQGSPCSYPIQDLLPIITNYCLENLFNNVKKSDYFYNIKENFMIMMDEADNCMESFSYYRHIELPHEQTMVIRDIVDWYFEILHVHRHHIIKIKNIQYNIFIHYHPKDWWKNNYRKTYHSHYDVDQDVYIIKEEATTKVVEKNINIYFDSIYPYFLRPDMIILMLGI